MTNQTPKDHGNASIASKSMPPGELGDSAFDSHASSRRSENQEMILGTSELRGHVNTTSEVSGSVVYGAKGISYVGATHWAAILDDVRLRLLLNET
jgi:hypothetical protein